MSLSNFSITTKRSYRRLLVVLFYGLLVLGGFLSTTRFDPGTWGGRFSGERLHSFSSFQPGISSSRSETNSTKDSSGCRASPSVRLTSP